MPNPLLNRQVNTSNDPPDRMGPGGKGTKPILEEYVGDNNPYRGVETHGVAPTVHPEFTEKYDPDEDGEEYDKPVEFPEPIPVKIVHETVTEFVDWIVRRETVDSNTRRIVQQNDRRIGLRVKNMDAAKTIYVFPESNNAIFLGWPLAPLEQLNLLASQADVWGLSGDGTQVEVAIMEEYTK
jgi:hypothetical protein